MKHDTDQIADLIDKISCLNGYLKMWASGKDKPFELNDLIEEVNEWIKQQNKLT